DKKELDKMKFKKFSQFRQELSEYTFLKESYFIQEISYQSSQGLLKGTIKKVEDLKSAYNEVAILYRNVEDGILIDSFFINTKDKE
ncbi:hypothetical protein, partial [Capnocytophaga stomatis]